MNPPTDQSSREQEAYWQGWCEAANWANRDDLRADRDSQAYADAMQRRLSTLPPTAITAEEAGREGEAKDGAPHWATCESRGSWVRNSLKSRIGDLRDGEKMCRRAYKQEYMGEPTKWYADALGEAAAVLERRLATLLPPAPAQSGGQGNG